MANRYAVRALLANNEFAIRIIDGQFVHRRRVVGYAKKEFQAADFRSLELRVFPHHQRSNRDRPLADCMKPNRFSLAATDIIVRWTFPAHGDNRPAASRLRGHFLRFSHCRGGHYGPSHNDLHGAAMTRLLECG